MKIPRHLSFTGKSKTNTVRNIMSNEALRDIVYLCWSDARKFACGCLDVYTQVSQAWVLFVRRSAVYFGLHLFVCLFIWDNVLHWDLKSRGKVIATVGQWAPRPACLFLPVKGLYAKSCTTPHPAFLNITNPT